MNVKHILAKASWLLTALGSIHLGLVTGFGMPQYRMDLLMYVPPMLIAPFFFLVGVSGIISLYMFLFGCCCEK